VAPWQMMNPESLATGTMAIDWGGLSGAITVTDGDSRIRVTDLGFGDDTSTVALDELSLFALDLNPASGRRVALTITPGTDGLPRFAVEPGVDLALAFRLAPLAAAGDLVESYLLDETYRLTFDGAPAPTAVPVEASDDGSFAGALAIEEGRLSLSSTAASAPVVATAGQCLVGDEVTDGEHPILGAFAVTACP
jgi:hypothetical protein